MAQIEVTTTVTVRRGDGGKSSFTETRVQPVGDNVRFFANDAEIQMMLVLTLLKSQFEHRYGKMPTATKKKTTKKKTEEN